MPPRTKRRRTSAPRPEAPVQPRDGEALVWTDGACRGNPGPGGWAAIVVPPGGGEAVETAGSAAHPTENRKEFTAGLERPRPLPAGRQARVVSESEVVLKRKTLWVAGSERAGGQPAGSQACVVTDSLLLLKSMTLWVAGWKRRGWKTAGGAPVKNRDLIEALESELARHAAVRWHWVRGHETGAAHAHKALNDRADRLAVAASHSAQAA